MIDIHCHLLPGIDDGPDTLDQAVALARIATHNGITHSVVTPHIHPGRYKNSKAVISAAYEAFRRTLTKQNIQLQLGFAAEVRLSPEVLQLVAQEDLPFYGEIEGYRILLLELPYSHVPPGSDKLVRWLLDHKIRPLIAHPERNKGIMGNIDHVKPFIELGCLFQVTAGSVAGQFGAAAQHTANQLLEMDCVTLLASDAHNIKHRPPQLDHGRDAAAAIVGKQKAAELVYDNPRTIVASQFSDLAALA